jgi:hypothetical protein
MTELTNIDEKKKEFLLRNEQYFCCSISHHVNLTVPQLVKYGVILNKEFLAYNTLIKWDIDTISCVIKLPGDNDIFFSELSYNEFVPWGIELIEYFEDRWNWELMAQNDAVVTNATLRNFFQTKLKPYLDEDFLNRAINRTMGLNGAGESIGEACEGFYSGMPFFRQHKEMQFLTPDEIEVCTGLDWRILSNNTLLPWSSELIEKYKDRWDWPVLCANGYVPWSVELMKKFEDKIDWTIGIPDENGLTTYDALGISENLYIQWDSSILSTYSHKLDPYCISRSISAKWDIDLLIEFNNFWDMEGLCYNGIAWKKVFSDLDGLKIQELLEITLARKNAMSNSY